MLTSKMIQDLSAVDDAHRILPKRPRKLECLGIEVEPQSKSSLDRAPSNYHVLSLPQSLYSQENCGSWKDDGSSSSHKTTVPCTPSILFPSLTRPQLPPPSILPLLSTIQPFPPYEDLSLWHTPLLPFDPLLPLIIYHHTMTTLAEQNDEYYVYRYCQQAYFYTVEGKKP